MFFSKEVNRLRNAKHLLLRKIIIINYYIFLGKNIWKNALVLKLQKGETFILALLSSAVFALQNHVSDFF